MNTSQVPPSAFCESNIFILFIYLFIYLFLKYLFTYLFGCTRSWLRQAGSLVVAFELLVVACMWDLVP